MTLLYCHRIQKQRRHDHCVNPDSANALHEEEFAALLHSLKGRLVNSDLCFREEKNKQCEDVVGLTFDDGYRDFKETALPYIEAMGVRVLLFVATQFADQKITPYEYVVGELLRLRPNPSVSNDLLKVCITQEEARNRYQCLLAVMKTQTPTMRALLVEEMLHDNGLTKAELDLPAMLAWEELQDLAEHPLVDIGAHTMSHPYLPSLGFRAAWHEIRDGKRLIEEHLKVKVETFAYPYGASNKRTRWMVRAAGFKYGFATDGAGKGRMAIPRTNVIEWINRSG